MQSKTNKLIRTFLISTLAVVALAITIAPRPSTAAATAYTFPCAGYQLSGYDFGQFVSGWGYHAAQDVTCPAATPLYAVADGQVVYSAKTPDSYRWGNLVLIQHTNPDGSQITSLYGHMSAARQVAAGQMVQKGQLIGYVGPGYTAENGNWGAHLHFGMRQGAYNAAIGTYAPGIAGYVPASILPKWVNPASYISGRTQVYDYQPVSVVGGGSRGKNEQYHVDVNLRNTGTVTWNNANFRLGTLVPTDRGSGFSTGMIGSGWVSPNRVYLMNNTAPGEVGTFRAVYNNASVAPGSYVERFAPLIEGQAWLPDKGISVATQVRPPVYGSSYIMQGAYAPNVPRFDSPMTPNYLVPGQKVNLKLMLRNTGDVAWQKGGPNPVRLGTSQPQGRASDFATGGDLSIATSENWPYYNRATGVDGRYDETTNGPVPADTIRPGEIGIFSFVMTAPSRPGTYREYFQPVMEGVTWLNDQGIYFDLRVLPTGLHYEYAGQDNPAPVAMGGGESEAIVKIRNTGQTSWPVGGNLRLGTDRTLDRASAFRGSDWLSPSRASTIDRNDSVPGKTVISPGEVAAFSFRVADSLYPDGSYSEYLRPVWDGVAWLPEDYGMFVSATVKSGALNHAFVSQSFDKSPATLRVGEKVTATVTLRNLGTTPWTNTGANPVRLGTSRPLDRASGFAMLTSASALSIVDPWLTANRASGLDGKNGVGATALDPNIVVRQGESAIFRVPMSVPGGLPYGAYPEYFNLVQEGVGWFTDLGIYFPLTINP